MKRKDKSSTSTSNVYLSKCAYLHSTTVQFYRHASTWQISPLQTPGSLHFSSTCRKASASPWPYTPTPTSHQWASGHLGVSQWDEEGLKTLKKHHYHGKHVTQVIHSVLFARLTLMYINAGKSIHLFLGGLSMLELYCVLLKTKPTSLQITDYSRFWQIFCGNWWMIIIQNKYRTSTQDLISFS